ncbi:MAG: hypothetical protein GYB67_10525 [Chloroflexi bacterium]|nr:hypothetical protein [Chloroflexota bacterium]
MSETINYPDIFSTITGGERAGIGAVHAALALRPQTAKAGQPLAVIALLQSTVDVPVEVSAAITLPGQDAKRARGRFSTPSPSIAVRLKPAEVGYVLFPVNIAAETAPGTDYKLSVEIEAKPAGKARTIRQPNGGLPGEPGDFSDAAQQKIKALTTLSYATDKRRGRQLEQRFSVGPGGADQPTDRKAEWVSVCALTDLRDLRPLLHLYGRTLHIDVLPQLKREKLYAPLLAETRERFRAAGYPLHDGEAGVIAKLLTLILEYASPKITGHGYVNAGRFDLLTWLDRDPYTFETRPALPTWAAELLYAIARDRRAAAQPIPTIQRLLYPSLLRDAMSHSFALIERETGESLGSAAEMAHFTDHLIKALANKSGLDFSRVYLPLVLGGLIINEQVLLGRESPGDLLQQVSLDVEQRQPEIQAEAQAVYDLTNDMLDRTGQKYGFRLS